MKPGAISSPVISPRNRRLVGPLSTRVNPRSSAGLRNQNLQERIENTAAAVLARIRPDPSRRDLAFGEVSPIRCVDISGIADSSLVEVIPGFCDLTASDRSATRPLTESTNSSAAPKKRDLNCFMRTSVKYGLKKLIKKSSAAGDSHFSKKLTRR